MKTSSKRFITCSLVSIFAYVLCKEAYANMIFPAVSRQFASYFVTGYYSIAIAIAILAIEARFLQKLLSFRYVWAFVLSFICNTISSFSGFYWSTIFPNSSIFAYGNMRLGTYLGLIPGYALTVVVEGIFLTVLFCLITEKTRPRTVFKTSMIMNLASYGILLIAILCADWLSHGKIFSY